MSAPREPTSTHCRVWCSHKPFFPAASFRSDNSSVTLMEGIALRCGLRLPYVLCHFHTDRLTTVEIEINGGGRNLFITLVRLRDPAGVAGGLVQPKVSAASAAAISAPPGSSAFFHRTQVHDGVRSKGK